ncbi:MAG: hypothetical protein CM15mP58_21300 [Burkholderiaceae bacterium]|nr:MAG: hypothetical protein CM15mP58_21300 [Burkholderiaceae bacterium]
MMSINVIWKTVLEIGIPTIKSMGNFILANVKKFTLVNGEEVPTQALSWQTTSLRMV